MCYSATYLQSIPFPPSHRHLQKTPRVLFGASTRPHTHILQNAKHSPEVRCDAVHNEQNLESVLSLVITASQSQKHTFTLADNKRPTRFGSISIVKIISHITLFFHTQTNKMSHPGWKCSYLSNCDLMSHYKDKMCACYNPNAGFNRCGYMTPHLRNFTPELCTKHMREAQCWKAWRQL